MSHTSVATLSIFKPPENTDSLSNSDSRSKGDSRVPSKTRSLSATRSSLRNSKQSDKNPLSVGEQRTRIPSTTRSSRNPVSKSASGSSVLERVKQTSDKDSSKTFVSNNIKLLNLHEKELMKISQTIELYCTRSIIGQFKRE